MFDKAKKVWDSHYLFPVRKPAEMMYDALRDSAVEFFKDAPSKAFFLRAGKSAAVLALFGVGMAVLPFGLSMGKVIALTLLQIPISIFQKDLSRAAQQFLRARHIGLEDVKQHKKLIIAGVICVAALGVAISVSPAAAAVLTFLRASANILREPVEAGALLLIKAVGQQLKNKAVKNVEENYDPEAQAAEKEQTGPEQGPLQEVLAAVSSLPAEDRQKVFDHLRADLKDEFEAAADTSAEGFVPPLHKEVRHDRRLQ